MSAAATEPTVNTDAVVDEVRALLRTTDRPLTARERCLLTALITRHKGPGEDTIDLLDAAVRAVRYRIRSTGGAAPGELIALLGAVDALLGRDGHITPGSEILDRLPTPEQGRWTRADTGGDVG